MTVLLQDPIDWHEGMLLEPQHLQHFETRISQSLRLALELQQPFPWGFFNLEVDESKLAGGILCIEKIQALFKNGLFIDWDKKYTKIEPLTFDLRNLPVDDMTPFYVFIGVHKSYAFNINEQTRTMGIAQSYLAANTNEQPNEIESQTPYMRPLLKMAFSEEDISEYTTLALLKMEKRLGSYRVVPFQPPRFFLPIDDYYVKKMKTFAADLRRKVGYLQAAQKNQTRAVDFTSQLILVNLLSLLPEIENTLQKLRVSPYQLFDITIRAVGALSAVKSTLVIPPLPAYNHDDFYACFDPIYTLANRLLSMISETYTAQVFMFNQGVYSLKIEESMIKDNTLFIGCEVANSVTQHDVSEWIKGAVIASEHTINDVKRARVLGASRTLISSDGQTEMFSDRTLVLVKISCDAFIKAKEALCIFNVNHQKDMRPYRILLFSRVD